MTQAMQGPFVIRDSMFKRYYRDGGSNGSLWTNDRAAATQFDTEHEADDRKKRLQAGQSRRDWWRNEIVPLHEPEPQKARPRSSDERD